MLLERGAVPAGDDLAAVVGGQFGAVIGQHGVAVFDVAVVVHHGLGHAGQAARAHMPLQPADPQHQLGQGGGAGVEFDAAQLLQRDGLALQAQAVLRLAQRFELVHHLAFEALQMFQRHVQKIAAAAGRIQHAGGAELVVKAADLGAGFFQLGLTLLAVQLVGLARQHHGGGLGVGPVGAQRLDHGGQHQTLDVGARRVVRAQGVALGGVEGAFQQGAEDGRLHFLPVGAGGAQQAVDLRRGERQRVAVAGRALEQLAVEAQHVGGNRRVEAAGVHAGPEDLEHLRQGGGLFAVRLEQVDEAAHAVGTGLVHLGQQAHVFGKHAEQTAREEGGHGLGRVAGGFQAARQIGQLGGHDARDPGADAARVQAERVGPQRPEPRADGGVGQLLQADAVAARVGKRGVGGAGAGELGVQLDDVAHVHHHHEGRAALGGGQGPGVVLGLGAGAQQRVVEGTGGRGAAGLRLDAGFQLLALPHEMAAAVAVHPAGAGAAVAVLEGNGALEHVALLGRGVRRLDAEQLTKLDDEALCGGQLRGGDAAPAGDEGGGAVGRAECVAGGRGGWCRVSGCHRHHHSERDAVARE